MMMKQLEQGVKQTARGLRIGAPSVRQSPGENPSASIRFSRIALERAHIRISPNHQYCLGRDRIGDWEKPTITTRNAASGKAQKCDRKELAVRPGKGIRSRGGTRVDRKGVTVPSHQVKRITRVFWMCFNWLASIVKNVIDSIADPWQY